MGWVGLCELYTETCLCRLWLKSTVAIAALRALSDVITTTQRAEAWRSGGRVDEVAQRWARLVLEWVTVFAV